MSTTKTTQFDPHRNDFRRKLGYYLTGLAIGLFLLGGFQVLKRVMAGKVPQNSPPTPTAGQAPPTPTTPTPHAPHTPTPPTPAEGQTTR